ncbi:MAG: thioredoxin family protein [Candidatus Heimdallarchaeaceae archaeon]
MKEKKKIQVFGSNCSKCKKQLEFVKKALEELEKVDEFVVEHITETEKIIDQGIFFTPAVLIDGKKISEGRVYSSEKLKKFLL